MAVKWERSIFRQDNEIWDGLFGLSFFLRENQTANDDRKACRKSEQEVIKKDLE